MFNTSRICKLVIVLASAIFAIEGCTLLAPPPEVLKPQAKIEIIEWGQHEYQILFPGFSNVRIDYRVTNTGSAPIGWCRIWFKVECADGSTFQWIAHSYNVSAAGYVSGHTSVDVWGKKAVYVWIANFELTN